MPFPRSVELYRVWSASAIVAMAAGLALTAVGVETALTLRAEYAREVDNILAGSDRTVQKLAARTAEMLERVDQTTRLIAFWELRGDAPSLQVLRKAGVIPYDAIRFVYTTDRRGFVTDTSDPSAATNLLNVADEDFFKVHLLAKAPESQLGQVWVSPIDAFWGLPMTRRLGSGADFGGVVVAMVDPGALSASYAQAERPGTVVGILGVDGVFRARSLDEKLTFGQHADLALMLERARRARAERVAFKSTLDGTSRFMSAAKVEGYPLYAVVAVEAHGALASYRQTRSQAMLLATLAVVATLIAAALALAQARRLDFSRRRAARSEADFRATIEGSLDGVMLLKAVRNGRGELTDMTVRDGNSLAADMISVPTDSLRGTRLSKLVTTQRLGELLPQFAQVMKTQTPSQSEIEASAAALPGRWFHHQFVPLDNGIAYISRDITAKILHARALEALAQTDELTGLANRRQFDDFAAAAMARAARSEATLALFYLDLDGFKLVNDRHGHAAGDAVLVEVAQRLRSSCRETDLVARPGGDEFAIVAEGAGTSDEVEALAARFVVALQAPIHIAGCDVLASASIGVAVFDGQESRERFIIRADEAMYQAKSAGRCTYRVAQVASSAAVEGRARVREAG